MSVAVHVPLGDRSYDIHIGQGFLKNSPQYLLPFLARPKISIVTDSNVNDRGHSYFVFIRVTTRDYPIIT